MACNASSCQSNCHRNEEQQQEEEFGGSANSISNYNNQNLNVCVKCKSNEPISGDNAEDGRFCADCFRSNLYGKFRLAVISNAMICPTDNVLVAFSGGPSSRSLSLPEIINWNKFICEEKQLCVVILL